LRTPVCGKGRQRVGHGERHPMSVTKALIIDDDRSIRDMLGRYLRSRGHEALTASDGPSGIETCRGAKPDVVLCDLRMPGMDGLEVLATLTREFPELPVLIVSGTGDLADAIQSLKRGAWDFVTKPIEDLAVLDHAVQKALERARLLEENRNYRQHLESANTRLEKSLRQIEQDEASGREIQFTLLPESPGVYEGYECSRFLAPSHYLSGDFVDYFTIDDEHFGFYIADVSGHGVASAVITVLLKSQVGRYRELFLREGDATILDPAALFSALNREVLGGQHGKYLTMFYGVIDHRAARLRFANAGQFPFPYLFDGTDVTQIGGRSPPVGLFEDAEYENHDMAIPPSFALRVFSDGVLEALSQSELGAQKEFLRALARDADANAEALARRIGLDRDEARADDATVLSLRRVASHG
jgi:phosphoserine phosphatase RsbU/P